MMTSSNMKEEAVRPSVGLQGTTADISHPLIDPVGHAVATFSAPRRRDRGFYFFIRRRRMRYNALLAITAHHGRKNIECMRCGVRNMKSLQLAHIYYEMDEGPRKRSFERSRDALQHPEKYIVLCYFCHKICDYRGPKQSKKKRSASQRGLRGRVLAIGFGLVRRIRIWIHGS